MTELRTGRLLLLVTVAALLVNLPLAHATWRDWTVQRNGVAVEAPADVVDVAPDVDGEGDPASYRVEFSLPEEVGAQDGERPVRGTRWPAVVDRATYDAVRRTGTLRVRVVEDDPALHTVAGEVRGRGMLTLTLLADGALLLMLLLGWRRARRSPLLQVVATEDVRRCPPGARWETLEGGRCLVAGDVQAIEDGAIVLDLGDRRVRVLLDGHRNPVGYQQPARVTGRVAD